MISPEHRIERATKPPNLAKKAAFAALSFLGALILVALGMELYFSVELGSDYFPIYAKLDRDLGYAYTPLKNRMHVAYAFRKNDTQWFKYYFELRINSIGFRGADRDFSRLSRPVVMSIGDSSTFGWGENEDLIFTSRLEKYLGASTVLNFGVPGYSSRQGLLITERWLNKVRPDFVTINFGANDSSDLFQQRPLQFIFPREEDKNIFGKPSIATQRYRIFEYIFDKSLFSGLLKKSRTLCWLITRLEITNSSDQNIKLSGINRVSIEDYKQNISAIIEKVREQGGKSVIIMSCSTEEYINAARETATATDTPIIVLRDFADRIDPTEFPTEYAILENRYGREFLAADKELIYTNDHCHPNPIGHRIIEEKLAAIIHNDPNHQ